MTDSLLTQNTNFLQETKFKLVFNRLPNVVYFCLDADVPGITVPVANHSMPFRDRPTPGDKLEWDVLNVVFNIDEEFANWKELYNWLRANSPVENLEERRKVFDPQRLGNKVYSDATLVATTSHNNAMLSFKFMDCFPTSLSGFRFTTTGSANEPIQCRATFQYLYYDIEMIRTATT